MSERRAAEEGAAPPRRADVTDLAPPEEACAPSHALVCRGRSGARAALAAFEKKQAAVHKVALASLEKRILDAAAKGPAT